ncbi:MULTISPECIES: MMPL family transporter [unclassified Actinopolyspora]|uniref:MMPL family transporter n=1 Tax=unclassified Actinopolyspora TaxID=2639451 RepID=UPI0013F6095D|nr:MULTISPECIES: MMPL family transporter [unclassified Actinopolyspora]NHD16739.1 MMPL family transporter [Actinopolyspora sp. BKK2]NHE75398.1 MMPL family transporter [Actinopolyspora sp. BKK1]
MARLLYRLGAGAHRHRLLVVLVWLVALAGAGVGAATLSGPTSDSFSIPGQESTIAQDKLQEEFDSGGGVTAKVVLRAPDGQQLTSPANVAEIKSLVSELSEQPGVTTASNPLNPNSPTISPDRTTAYSTVTYDAAMGEVTSEQREALLDTVDQADQGPFTVEVSGQAVMATPSVGGPAEAIGVIAALVILALTYGSLVTAGMNLVTAGVGVGIGALGISIATGFMELQSTTSILATMLGLAVGIDYALFIINRHRQELRRGTDLRTSVATAVGTAGSAVLTAGITVFIALAGLSVVGIPFLTQMGLAAAATIVVAVLVALTLVPAVLGYLGHRVLPRKQRTAPAVAAESANEATAESASTDASESANDRSFHQKWINAVTRGRVPALLISLVALGVVAIPAASMQTTLVQTPSEGTTQARAQQMLADSFGPGVNGPLVAFFEGDGAPRTAQQASGAISGLDDVATVTPPVPNASGDAAMLTVIPESGPSTQETEQLVGDLRDQLADIGGADSYVTGTTAVSVDVAQALDQALPIYLVLVVGLALILLVLVFRSVLVPLVGVLGFLLTLGAALGATVAVFQWGWLSNVVNLDDTGPLISLTPILMIGILFGLAMDYQIFLVSRMHEAYHKGHAPRGAIVNGFRQAAPVVVAAALIMFSVFAGFVPAGNATIKSIAFALAVGILVDAFVVRMVLMPAALALLGRAAWWLPGWLRWLPALDVEGSALAEVDDAGGETGSDERKRAEIGS